MNQWRELEFMEVEEPEDDPPRAPGPGINRHTELDLAPSNQAIHNAHAATARVRKTIADRGDVDTHGRSGRTLSEDKKDMARFVEAYTEHERWNKRMIRSKARK